MEQVAFVIYLKLELPVDLEWQVGSSFKPTALPLFHID